MIKDRSMEKQIFSPSSTREDKAILVQLMQTAPLDEKIELDELMTYKWYIIEQEKDKEGDQNSKEELKEEEFVVIGSAGGKLRLLELPKMPYAVPITGAQCFPMGSRIYACGGMSNYYTYIRPCPMYQDVYYLDIRRPHDGWKEGPYLNWSRAFCVAAVDNEKAVAYITSQQVKKKQPAFEVFDFHNDIWKPLPPPPVTAIFSMAVVFDGGNKLLCYSSYCPPSACCYNVKDGTWEVFDRNFGDWDCQPALIGSTLFCYGALPGAEDKCIDCALYAYDLVKREWFSEPVRGLEQQRMLPIIYDYSTVKAHLFHINKDKLCLLWCGRYCKFPDRNPNFHIHCTKFRISKDDKGYLAHVESYNDYVLDDGSYDDYHFDIRDTNFLAI